MQIKRLENYKYLKDFFLQKGIKPIVDIENSMCPLFFPIYVENRNRLQRYLIKNRIYCAVHWPYDVRLDKNDNLAFMMSKHELSLPIDQRYNLNDMQYMIERIQEYGDLI